MHRPFCGLNFPMILRRYWLGRVYPPGTDQESSATVAITSRLIAHNGIPHRTANRFSVTLAPNNFSICATGSTAPASPKARQEILWTAQKIRWQTRSCASLEILFPFSVLSRTAIAWSVPRPKLSRFDVPRHNINQPALIAFDKVSLRFY
jgi:hypothetical protein